MNSPRRSAFTLLEVLVATAILALIVVVLASLVSQSGRIWSSVDSQNQRRSIGRAMLQFIVRDLEMAVIQAPYPAATNAPNLQFIANLPNNASNSTFIPNKYLNPHAAFWQAPVANDKSKGDIAEVGYFVQWETNKNVVKSTLCRLLVEPTDTNHFLIYGDTNGNAVNWLADTNIISVASASSSNNYKGWFADNVIALWIRCVATNGNAIKLNAAGDSLANGYGFDSRQGYSFTNSANVNVKRLPSVLPPVVDIALVTVDSRTAQKITPEVYNTIVQNYPPANTSADAFGQDKNTPGSVAYFMDRLPAQIKPGAQVFTTRAYLKNASR